MEQKQAVIQKFLQDIKLFNSSYRDNWHKHTTMFH